MDQTETTQAPDRRIERRQRVFKGARLSFNGGFGAMEGVIRNLSDSGARIHFGESLAVPPKFRMQVIGEPGDRAAVVRWRSATDIGVALEG